MTFLPDPLLAFRRRKLRTLLAITGVAAGVFAMELLAAVSTHFRSAAHGLEASFLHRAFVCERVTFWAGGGILSETRMARVTRVPGVRTAVPMLVGRLEPERLVVLGVPEVLVGVPFEQAQALWPGARLAAGRWLDSDAPAAVLGAELAAHLGAVPGQSVSLLGHAVPVQGILEAQGTLVDRQALVPLPVAQSLLDREGLVTDVVVEGDIDLDVLGHRIEQAVPDVHVVTPARLADEVGQSVAVWDALALVLGLGSIVGGGITVAVTSLVSVQERTAEIAIRRAVGASAGQIFGDVLVENGLLILLGWGAGTAGVALFVALASRWLESVGAAMFTLTPGLLATSAAITVVLGLLAAAIPAAAAARTDVLRGLHG
jgi:putative ABC transport system permease protein